MLSVLSRSHFQGGKLPGSFNGANSVNSAEIGQPRPEMLLDG